MTMPTLVLILIFSPFQIGILQRGTDLAACTEEAARRMGEPLQAKYWDDLNGSNPIPKVVAAFCAPGIAKER